jgi:NAD(P)-dependent dehydrogenase (short-subunit alcohol dehydrogenase family)
MATMGEQQFAAVSSERMEAAFQLNTLGPLRVQQSLQSQMVSPGGKVFVISSGMGSIADNTSGGIYAYRTAKAAVNMVCRCMAADFKEAGIAVTAVNPGMVVTEFGPGREALASMGAMPVSQSVEGLLKVRAAYSV